MGYNSNNLSLHNGQIGGSGPRLWQYWSADSIATIVGASYISDATKKGVQVGDVVMVFSGTLNTSGPDASPSTAARGTVSEFASDPSFAWMVADSISSGAATLKEIAVELGAALGFYGATPVAQPSGASQAAVTVTAVTALATTVFSAAMTGMWAFSSSTVAKTFQPRINQLIVDVAALKTLLNKVRAGLVPTTGVGLLKGGA